MGLQAQAGFQSGRQLSCNVGQILPITCMHGGDHISREALKKEFMKNDGRSWEVTLEINLPRLRTWFALRCGKEQRQRSLNEQLIFN